MQRSRKPINRERYGLFCFGGMAGWVIKSKIPQMREDGHDIRTIQELLGHKGVSTTMI